MIKLEHIVTPSPEQMEFVIEGMRNPMNSWINSDSRLWAGDDRVPDEFELGKADKELMYKLAEAGTDHRKFMRMMPVMIRITAPLYWWKEFDTYKVGTVANSCSTMHKIADKEFTYDDFSTEHLMSEYMIEDTITELNRWRKLYINYEMLEDSYKEKVLRKDIWWQMIQLLPSSYNQTRNVSLNYEALRNIFHARKEHKLNEWREFCNMMVGLPYAELITGERYD